MYAAICSAYESLVSAAFSPMFQEAIDHVLGFVGVHCGVGCSSVAIGDFIDLDLLPSLNLSSNTVLRTSIVRLLLTQHFDQLQVQAPSTPSKERGKTKGKAQASATTATFSLLSQSEAIRFIDEGKVKLSEHSAPTCELLVFLPLPSLCEKVLGTRLQRPSFFHTLGYVCSHAVDGIIVSGAKGESGQASAQLTKGLSILKRRNVVHDLFFLDCRTLTLTKMIFPAFSLPIPFIDKEPPLQRYFRRIRKQRNPNGVIIISGLVKQVIKSSPERRLLLEDAVIAIFKAHGLSYYWNDFERHQKRKLIQMIENANLRVMNAQVVARGVPVVVKVVTTADDTMYAREEDTALGRPSAENQESPAATNLEYSAFTRTAAGVFISSPDFPRSSQLGYEAERRPIAIASGFPPILLFGASTLRPRIIVKDLQKCMNTYKMIEKKRVLLSETDSNFSIVYYPKEAESSQRSVDCDAFGVSSFSADKVLQLLDASPYKAVTMTELSDSVDRKALNLRILPYLVNSKMVVTSGVTVSNKRIGIVALASVAPLSEELKLHVATLREKEREISGKKAEPLPSIPMVPAAERSAKSTWLWGDAAATRAASKVMLIRNGYTANMSARAGRLHLELWWQWWHQQKQEDVYTMALYDVYQSLSLSTFCIIVGMPTVDLGVFSELNQSSRDSSSPPSMSTLQWSTALKDLPTALRLRCQEQGLQSICMCVQQLVNRKLIECSEVLDAASTNSFQNVYVTLMPSTKASEKSNVSFYSEREQFTPSKTAYAILLYWRPTWMSDTPYHAVFPGAKAARLAKVEPLLTLAKTIALARLLRTNVGPFAALLFQRQGWNPIEKSKASRAHRALLKQISARKEAPSVPVLSRVAVSSQTVGSAVRHALKGEDPLALLKEVFHTVKGHRRSQELRRFFFAPVNSTEMASWYADSYHRHSSSYSGAHLDYLSRTIEKGCASLDASLVPRQISAFLSPSAGADSADSSPLISTKDPAQPSSLPETPLSEEAASSWDTLLNLLRCIVLSDEVHYSAEHAAKLLSHFPEEMIEEAKHYLRAKSGFAKGSSRDRLPFLRLSTGPSLISVNASRVTDHVCANSVLMDDLVLSLDRNTSAASPPHELLYPSGLQNSHLLCAEEDPSNDAPSVTLRCPTVVELKQLLKSERVFTSLHFPSLSFSGEVYAAEELRKRNRTPEAATTWPMHPARLIRVDSGRTAASQAPGDPPPTASELSAVQTALTHMIDLNSTDPSATPLASAPQQTQREDGDRHYPVRYPSIFHHLDGSFHSFMWRTFLEALHKLITATPGVHYASLDLEMTRSGIVTKRDLDAGIAFLLDSKAIRGRWMGYRKRSNADHHLGSSARGELHFCRMCFFAVIGGGGLGQDVA